MASINLFKIDLTKEFAFKKEIGKYDFIGKQEIEYKDELYGFNLYISNDDEKKECNWNWIINEIEGEAIFLDSSPKGIVVIEKGENIYAVTFGHAFFSVDKVCDRDFAFDFARRASFNEVKTTTVMSPQSRRNRTVSTFVNYEELEFDSGESFAKLKVVIGDKKENSLFSPAVEIGNSIKFNLKKAKLDKICELIYYVEETQKSGIRYKIPLYSLVKDKEMIARLEARLLKQISDDISCINISELDIIGATEVFNRNDGEFELKFQNKRKIISSLSKDEIEIFCSENSININENLLDIQVTSFYNSNNMYSDCIHNLIEYIDDNERCLLSKGKWYYYNDDYVEYLDFSIGQLKVVYNEKFNFSSKKHLDYLEELYIQEKDNSDYKMKTKREVIKLLERKHYKERAFNEILENHGFINYDRDITVTDSAKLEYMDLYEKETKTMLAVKIGSSSSKLCYAVDQSETALKMFKKGNLKIDEPIQSVGVWLILKRKNKLELDENGNPDLSKLNMLMLKNRLDLWKKTVLLAGYIPVIYLNYYSD